MASMAPHVRAAANLIAKEARRLAASWSVQVPPSITVKARGNTAEIKSAVGPAYPNEVIRVRHPVFGPTLRNPRPAWVTNDHRPFLAPACDAKADDAAAEIAKYIDDVAHDNGFEGTG